LPIKFKYQISIALILMALMTISRGPWIGGFAGAMVAMVGNFKNRRLWLGIVIAALLAGGIAGKAALTAYTTPNEDGELSAEAGSMLYRRVMLDLYEGYLMQKLWTGWGVTTVPEVPGMKSVDNAFFWMALQHGVIAAGLFFVILLYAIISQIKFGLNAPPDEPPMGFTFAGIYLMCLIAFATVYLGGQTEPMIFMLLGWGENIKNRLATARPLAKGPATTARAGPAGPFRRVMH
jgi:hypothetical protein